MTIENWTDEQLGRELARLERGLEAVEVVDRKVVALEVELANIRDDLRECKGGIQGVHDRFSVLRKELSDRRGFEREEKKKDRRWWAGSLFAASGIIIAAVNLLADKV